MLTVLYLIECYLYVFEWFTLNFFRGLQQIVVTKEMSLTKCFRSYTYVSKWVTVRETTQSIRFLHYKNSITFQLILMPHTDKCIILQLWKTPKLLSSINRKIQWTHNEKSLQVLVVVASPLSGRTFSAVWLRSSVVSVLFSVKTENVPTGYIFFTCIFRLGRP